jgi:DNA-binding CsgD family transcriptional regulator
MPQNVWNLNPREVDVLACLVTGKSNREIAAELNISISTVKAHLSSLYQKLGVSSRLQASVVGLRILPMVQPTPAHGTGSAGLV